MERNCMSQLSTHAYACVKNELRVQLLYFSHTLLVLSFLPLLYFFPGATGCCLKAFPDMCCHLLWSQKLDQNTNTESQKSQAIAWYLYTSSSSSSVPLHLSPLYPTHSALGALSSGEVVWLYIIHGSCDVRHVSYGRSNKMEYRREYEEQHRERHRTLSLLLPCTTLFTSNGHVGVQNSFDLSWNGRPRIGQHNRSCFEMLDLLEKCSTIEMAGFHSYILHLAGAVTLHTVNSQSVITTPLQLINGEL